MTNLIQALPPDRADHALDVSVLPRGAWCRDGLSDSYRRDPLAEGRTVGGVAVAQQKARRCLPRERFNYLPRKPSCRGMLRNIEPNNLSATVSQDDHDVEQSKRGRHGDERVDGGDSYCFVAQKATPCR